MAHTSEKRWRDVNTSVGMSCDQLISALNSGEELYQQLLELWTYAGGTDQLVADLLFETTDASSDLVAVVADAKAASVAIHQIYEAADNIAVTQEDRLSKLRRMV